MNKKLNFLLICVFSILMLIVGGGYREVYAREVSSVWTIDTDTEVNSETIDINNISSSSAIVINANVVFNDVTINIGQNIDIDQLINIASGSLTLNNVILNSPHGCPLAIFNNGVLVVNKLTIIGTITKTIVNNSVATSDQDKVDKLQLLNVNSPLSITLQKGFISVYEDSIIDSQVNIDLGVDGYTDDMIGRVLVKGRNTLANFYQNMFVLKNTPNPNEYNSASEYLAYLQANTPYYLDYVGDIGDEFAVADDGYSEQKNGVDVVTNLESGDLILTKFIVGFTDSVTTEKVCVAGKYATTDIFVNASNSVYKMRANIVEDLTAKTSSTYFVMNNLAVIRGGSNNSILVEESRVSDKINVNIDVYIDNVKSDELSFVESVFVGGQESFFIDIGDNKYLEMSSASNKVEVVSELKNNRFVRPVINCLAGATDTNISVYLESTAPTIAYVDVVIDQKEFTYSKDNYASMIKPYYVLNSEKVELEANEYSISNNLTNADTYIITYSSQNSNIVFNQSEDQIVINPKLLSLTFDNEFEYDGTAKSVDASVSGVINGDIVNVSLSNNSRIITGSQSVNVSIDNANYKLSDQDKQVDLIINKGTIDMSGVVFDDVAFDYDGTEHVCVASNIPNHVRVSYTNNKHTNVCQDADYYIATATFSIADEHKDHYNDLAVTSKTAKITINRAVIDTSILEFDNINHVYDKNYVTATINGELPNGVARVEYTNNSHKNASATPYVARATFIIDDEYKDNYVIVPAYKEATITISKARVDFSQLEYDDQTITYDGQLHRIVPTGYDSEILSMSYDSIGATNFGEYTQRIKFTLIDTNNYEELTDNEKVKTATLFIKKATISTTSVVFPNINHVYNGKEVVAKVIGTLPQGIMSVSYNNNKVTNYTPESLIATATFILDPAYSYNYEAVPAILTANINVSQAEIDFSNFVFADKSVYYDGEEHKILVSGIDETKLNITYHNTAETLVGRYPQRVTMELKDSYNYKPLPVDKTDMTVYLTIKKISRDMQYLSMANKTFVYDGYPHELELKYVPSGISYELTNNPQTNVGKYTVTVNLIYDDSIYEITNFTPISAILEITPAEISLNGIKFENTTFEYNGEPKAVVISGQLPDNVAVTYTDNTRTNAGTSTAVAHFSSLDPNYSVIDSKTCKIIVNPKPVRISLVQNKFTYTGQAITVQAVVEGVINNDSYSLELLSATNTNAGTYNAVVKGNTINNDNYIVVSASLLQYEISKIEPDMSGVSFSDIQIEYDGKAHSPELKVQGTLPNGIIYSIIGGEKVNVGEYEVFCNFTTLDQNYIVPERMTAILTITPKPLLIEFDKYVGIVSDGTNKEIDVKIIGLVDDNFDGYSIVYSATPNQAGVYTCTVNLHDNTNYVILGKNSITFEILTAVKTYNDQVYDITIEGDGFSHDTQVSIINDESQDIVNTLNNNFEFKKFKAFSIAVDGEDQEIDVSLSIRSFVIENTNYLSVYKLESNKLKKINYSIEDGQIKFLANTNDKIIILEELNNIDKNQVWIYLIVILSVISLMLIISISIVYIMSNKRK